LKYGKNKSALAEFGILLTKKKIFLMEKTLHTNDWPSLLPKAVFQLNSRPLKRLNGLSPNDLLSQWDDYKVQQAASTYAKTNPNQTANSQLNPDLNQQLANQKAYESNPKEFQVNSYVYVDYKPKSFAKSFLPKAS
jgi:hypothetical protein